MANHYQGIIKAYPQYLPVQEKSIVSLCEGATPLLEAPKLAERLCPGTTIYLKLEGLNPTGSFKDRGMTYAVSKAHEAGSKAIICASTGNTSASAAAYAARSGLRCIVLIPDGKIALGKLSQAMMHGAEVLQIKGNFDDALRMVKEFSQSGKVTLVNSVNPFRLIGQRTLAYEVVDELGEAPDYHVMPVGNAGNITAHWGGYKTYFEEKKSKKLPKLLGFQAAGAAPIVLGHVVENPETLATAIRIGNPASWQYALEAQRESQGLIDSVTDEEILEAYQFLAREEGYFCEPASAATVAGLFKISRQNNFFKAGEVIVCTLTGHGLKDPDNAIKISPKPKLINASMQELEKVISI
ncbi:MAG: threonine synthase [Deltaproteobacteria bacterium]|nr:threonine synthase [Deltaproteobacteria bacterium]